ncbi:UvrD-helicase domain-containing protein [Bacillus tamaricis]|uniref:UvrD-helicase domain-containing protein n=2 Tax=Evansella tamaricis TaxID=2069301 RepID=A0ABS6JHR2_9BACI|nr:UvrD-helicase domain-containing protein [Evansella tamaricis]
MDVISQKMEDISENVGGLKEGIIELRKNFWDEITVNLDDAHEVGETFTSIKQQTEMLSERERTHKHYYTKYKNLLKLKENPYFGRVDFSEEGVGEVEKIYVGIASLMDEEEEEFLIYDWRAPISSLYYNFSPGQASYEVPEETVRGEMTLKRQFIIRKGKLKSMFDTEVTIGDEMLQEVLGNNANTSMKSIVATIQKDQNQIIRNETSKYLIVQGAAGSGKTSAALQRVAYLLYRYRGKIKSDNIMLFSPNYIFNSYVANVLPELGEENMKQSTFFEYMTSRLGKIYSVEDPLEQMEFIYSNDVRDSNYDIRMQAIKFKASKEFKEVVDNYITLLSDNYLLFKDCIFRGEIVLPADEIQNKFYSLDKNLPIPNRMNLVAEWLLIKLKEMEGKELKKEWVMEEMELLDKEDYLNVYKEVQHDQEVEDSFTDYEKEEKLLAKKVVQTNFKGLKRWVKKLRFLNMKSIYQQLYENVTVNKSLGNSILPDKWKEISQFTIGNLNDNIVLYEDATPLLYLTDRLEGRKPNTFIRHLFIDEAQDYSPFQLEYFKLLFPNSKMTILGDFNQGIYPHSIEVSSLIPQDSFELESGSVQRMTITQSYRSTKEIVNFTKGFVRGGELIEPFNRSGDKPTITIVSEEELFYREVVRKVILQKDNGTVAIICKTAEQSANAYTVLKERLPDLRLLTKDSTTFHKGVVILPAYLAKGIEFDTVVIYDASDKQYGREMDRKLFYTACTRAMHHLHLISLSEKSRFIKEAERDTYVLQ